MEIIQLATKIYKKTPYSFIKSEYAPSERPKNVKGEPIIWKWGAKRLQNECDALALIAEYTDIPVPKVLYCGKDENGIIYLEVELKDGLDCSEVGDKCRMPPEQAHTADGRCLECEKIANENVNNFIETKVIPQLKELKSNQTGLNGIVIPPPRIQEFDKRDIWRPKQSSPGQEYVFCHGDLSRSNILVDPETLDVMCIIDWECSGYFPAELELPMWRLDYEEYMQTFRDEDRIRREITIIM